MPGRDGDYPHGIENALGIPMSGKKVQLTEDMGLFVVWHQKISRFIASGDEAGHLMACPVSSLWPDRK
jgi:hypothetical protein